jgi:tRNA (guanine37-N1)-methyltransferase
VILDAVIRTIEGVLGDPQSVLNDTFNNGLLKYPQYTRPENSPYGNVPNILLSGNHESIKRWQLKQSLAKTKKNRPDLLKNKVLTQVEKELLEEILREEKD